MTVKYVRLRNLREDSDLTQKDIGNVLKITQRSYAYYESGERMIPLPMLEELADFYDVSVDYILERTNDKRTYGKLPRSKNVKTPASVTDEENSNKSD